MQTSTTIHPHFVARCRTILVLLAALLTAGSATAGPRSFGPGMDGGFMVRGAMHRLMHMADELDLTEEQRAAAEAVFVASADQARALSDDLRANHQALRDITPEDYDPAFVAELAQAQGALTTQMVIIKAEARRDLLALLTAEQRERLDQLRPHGRREGRRGRRG